MIPSHLIVKFLLISEYHLSISMKKLLTISAIVIISLTSFAQNKILIGASANYNVPVGMLSNRLQSAPGFLIYAGKQTSQDWTWVGKLEYFELSEVNKSKMKKFVKSDILGPIKTFEFPLPNIKMDLTVAGLTAEAKYNFLNSELIDANINLGFGFYFWEHFRSSYKDSLFVDSTGRGNLVLVEVLNVPSLRQKDWSGGVNFGLDFIFILFNPISFNLSANYKLIIAELWPTLALNLENVSGLQFVDLRAGIRFDF